MKKHIIYNLLLWLIFPVFTTMPGITVLSQETGYSPMKDTSRFLKNLEKATSQITSIQSDFIQEKKLDFIDETIISKGKFVFQKDNKIRWEYTSPFEYLIIMNDGKIYINDGNRANEFDANSNKLFQQINYIIAGSIQGTLLNDETLFSREYFENEEFYYVRLTPLSSGIRDFLTDIYLYFDKNDYSVSKLKMVEQSDDYTIIKFSNKIFNQAVSEDKFKKD